MEREFLSTINRLTSEIDKVCTSEYLYPLHPLTRHSGDEHKDEYAITRMDNITREYSEGIPDDRSPSVHESISKEEEKCRSWSEPCTEMNPEDTD